MAVISQDGPSEEDKDAAISDFEVKHLVFKLFIHSCL